MLAQKRAFVYSSRNGGAGDGGRATPMWPYGGRCLSQKLHFYERSHGEQIVFFLSIVEEVSKRIRKHVLLFLSSFRYTHESLGGLEKAVITLACHSARFVVHVVR